MGGARVIPRIQVRPPDPREAARARLLFAVAQVDDEPLIWLFIDGKQHQVITMRHFPNLELLRLIFGLGDVRPSKPLR